MAFNKKKKRSKSKSPYEKSVDVLVKLKKEDVAFHFKKVKRKCTNHIDKQGSENCVACNCNDKKNTSTNGKKFNDNTIQMKNSKKHTTNNLNTVENNRCKKDRLPNTNLGKNIQVITSAEKVLLDTQSSNDNPPIDKSKNSEVRRQSLLDKETSSENVMVNSKNHPNDGNKIVEKSGKVVRKHGSNFTFPITSKEKTNQMNAIHQNLIKIKKVAGQAIKV